MSGACSSRLHAGFAPASRQLRAGFAPTLHRLASGLSGTRPVRGGHQSGRAEAVPPDVLARDAPARAGRKHCPRGSPDPRTADTAALANQDPLAPSPIDRHGATARAVTDSRITNGARDAPRSGAFVPAHARGGPEPVVRARAEAGATVRSTPVGCILLAAWLGGESRRRSRLRPRSRSLHAPRPRPPPGPAARRRANRSAVRRANRSAVRRANRSAVRRANRSAVRRARPPAPPVTRHGRSYGRLTS